MCRAARETKHSVITRHRRRPGEEECDRGADDRRTERRYRDPPRREGEGSGDQAKRGSRQSHPAAMVGRETRSEADEGRKCMNCKRE